MRRRGFKRSGQAQPLRGGRSATRSLQAARRGSPQYLSNPQDVKRAVQRARRKRLSRFYRTAIR